MGDGKDPISFRLSGDAISLLRELAAHYGISQAGVVEMGTRLLAEKVGYRLPVGAGASKRKVGKRS